MGERLQCQKNYFCSFLQCKARFNKLWKLEAHQCKHTGLKPFTCESCDKSFRTRYQLFRHGLRHSGEKPHKCLAEGCSELFVSSTSMKNHMLRVHLQQRKLYHCNHMGCEKCFRKRHQLHAHNYEHTQAPHFQCTTDGCAKSFVTRGKLKQHEKMHQGYSCGAELCLFVAPTWMQYLKHRQVHAAKLPCNTSKKQFKKNLFRHQHASNVQAEGKKELICPKVGCDKKFSKGFNLESHVLGDHEGKKPFDCVSCGKSFAMLESLWRHGVVHDPEKKRIKKLLPKKSQPWQVAQRKAHRSVMDKLVASLENVEC
ncbi:general transcription factor IIIA, b isoform X2 [Synchiropus splendidus]|uniref:general transcription factor IIIA, b isoform X2 n=1 Tax=Synchiropus splendidus TaxID=270530 RepID=UPI00237DDF48|nr:general transcription factor IIIA, b isoform X2 [Synchiropus splendidus]